jgi:hypothetical protein
MEFEGNLLKMRTELTDPVHYFLKLGSDEIFMNELLNKEIELIYLNQIHCIKCGRSTSKSFAQGFCFPCFRSAPETEDCVLRPELCKAHEGIARDIEFAKQHCLIDHVVYIAYTSGIKVGVTRNTQIPTRWIDQGALAAIKIAIAPNRYTAGVIEIALKSNFADKTNWRNMLKSNEATFDLRLEKANALHHLAEDLKKFSTTNDKIISINYPYPRPHSNISSINLDKDNYFKGNLTGIKGQYLVFNDGHVINIRKYGGYLIKLKY